jgi:hypothetical protein
MPGSGAPERQAWYFEQVFVASTLPRFFEDPFRHRTIAAATPVPCHHRAMAFGQQSGPPATHRQLQELLDLVVAAGHLDLKDARGPLGLTQRQSAGKFTRDEAEALIEQLQAAAEAGGTDASAASEPEPDPAATTGGPASPTQRTRATPRPKPAAGGAVAAARARREAEAARQLRELPDHLLAAELQRRGWAVMEP